MSPLPGRESRRASSPWSADIRTWSRCIERAEVLGARLLQAAAEGHDTAVRQLIATGAPVNVTDAAGRRPS